MTETNETKPQGIRTPLIPAGNIKRTAPLNKPSSNTGENKHQEDFNNMSPEDKIIYLKTKLARTEANLTTLTQPSAINRAVDAIFDLRRQLNFLTSDKVKQYMHDEGDRLGIFELITLNAKQVATKRSNSLIITGHPGVGKTMTVIQAVAFLNPHPILNTVINVEDEEDEPKEEVIVETEEPKEIKIEVEPATPIEKKIRAPYIPADTKRINKTPKVKVIAPKVESRNNTESGYFIADGGCTTAALYELLFVHRKKLLIFNDFDTILKDPESVNLLKSVLDTYPIREVSRMTKGNTFSSFGMSDAEMQEKYELEGKLPNQFRFTGGIIFVSNIHEDKFDKALLSRSLHVEVRLTRQQVIERMIEILPDLRQEVPMEHKMEALNYLDFITSNYRCKQQLDIRQLLHTIDNRSEYPPENPAFVREGKNGRIYIWQQMAKERLIERVFKYD